MITDFLNTIKGELTGQLAGKTELSQDKLGSAADIVTNTFKEGIKDKAATGQFDDIAALLGKGGASSGFANNLIKNAVGNLVGKLGLPQNIANQVATFAVPFVINKLGSFASAKGKDNKEGVQELLGDLIKGSVKDKLLGGLGKKFGF